MRNTLVNQLNLLPNEVMTSEAYSWARSNSEKGQVYTKKSVVDFMIALLGLNCVDFSEKYRILEPSCGEGEFVVGLAEAIISSGCRDINLISKLVTAIDLVEDSIQIAKQRVSSVFLEHNFKKQDITTIIDSWFIVGDFLLMDIPNSYSHVIGNPPYVRIESIPKMLLDKYRKAYWTMTNRADLYVAFFERALNLLSEEGILSFICTDRWTKNIYGKNLRSLISKEFALDYYIDSYGSNAFESNVMTYPAVTQIRKGKYAGTKVIHKPNFSSEFGISLKSTARHSGMNFIEDLQNGSAPWIIKRDSAYNSVKKIESNFPYLESSGCRVYIGTATGANNIYLINSITDIEPDRLLPAITAKEIRSGQIAWRKKYIINTYDDNGVIDLRDFPKLSRYFLKHKDTLTSRHIAKLDPKNWYKTIDRIFPNRVRLKKLMISDIGDKPIAVIDDGFFQPNNSIYYICSTEWDLNAVKCIILSQITKDFIKSYSTMIAHGYMRFQAQHLRKLRLPKWHSIPDELKSDLINAGINNTSQSYDDLAFKTYKI